MTRRTPFQREAENAPKYQRAYAGACACAPRSHATSWMVATIGSGEVSGTDPLVQCSRRAPLRAAWTGSKI